MSKLRSSSSNKDDKTNQRTGLLSSIVVQPSEKDTSKRGVISKTNPVTHDEFDDDWLSYKSEIAAVKSKKIKKSRKRTHSIGDKRKEDESSMRKSSGSYEEHLRGKENSSFGDKERERKRSRSSLEEPLNSSVKSNREKDGSLFYRKEESRGRSSREGEKKDVTLEEGSRYGSVSEERQKYGLERSYSRDGITTSREKSSIMEINEKESKERQNIKRSDSKDNSTGRHFLEEQKNKYELKNKEGSFGIYNDNGLKKTNDFTDNIKRDSFVRETLNKNDSQTGHKQQEKHPYKPKSRRKVSVVNKTFLMNSSSKKPSETATEDLFLRKTPDLRTELNVLSEAKGLSNRRFSRDSVSENIDSDLYTDPNLEIDESGFELMKFIETPGMTTENSLEFERQKEQKKTTDVLEEGELPPDSSPEKSRSWKNFNVDHNKNPAECKEGKTGRSVKLHWNSSVKNVKEKRASKKIIDIFADDDDDDPSINDKEKSPKDKSPKGESLKENAPKGSPRNDIGENNEIRATLAVHVQALPTQDNQGTSDKGKQSTLDSMKEDVAIIKENPTQKNEPKKAETEDLSKDLTKADVTTQKDNKIVETTEKKKSKKKHSTSVKSNDSVSHKSKR